jgi:hypothetical protein
VTSKKFGLSSHSPVELFLRRVLHATRSEHTDMPLGSERSSGSRVRFPVRTTRLMFVAATKGLLSTAKAGEARCRPSLGVGAAVIAAAPQIAGDS